MSILCESKSNESPETVIQTSSTYPIHVAPLPHDITEEDLTLLFSLCGPIAGVRILQKILKGYVYALINFENSDSREKAKKFYHGKKLGPISLKVVDDKYFDQKTSKDQTDDKQTIYGDDSAEYDTRPKKKFHSNSSHARPKNEKSFRFNNHKGSAPLQHKDSPEKQPSREKDFYQKEWKSSIEQKKNTTNKKTVSEPRKERERTEDSFEY